MVSSGTGQSFGFEKFWALVLAREFSAPEFGYPMGKAHKDMVVTQATIEACGIDPNELRVLQATGETYSKALELGLGDEHKGAMVKVYEAAVGTPGARGGARG